MKFPKYGFPKYDCPGLKENLTNSIDFEEIEDILDKSEGLLSIWAKICFGLDVDMEMYSHMYIKYTDYKKESFSKRFFTRSKSKNEIEFRKYLKTILRDSRGGFLYRFKYSQLDNLVLKEKFSSKISLKIIEDNAMISVMILDYLMTQEKFPKIMKKYLDAIYFKDIFGEL